mmetsp:Transcript_2229/g.4930  ORF Transcript_2229/g.4930 Transcript_2229/m.4930 type:complete len:684 (-) Transcript_2229:59-2110(-)
MQRDYRHSGRISNITFQYHMYGAAMGNATLSAATYGPDGSNGPAGSSWVPIWSRSGDDYPYDDDDDYGYQSDRQGGAWKNATRLLSVMDEYVFLRFNYTSLGSDETDVYYRGDFAIDNIRVSVDHHVPSPAPTVTPAPSTSPAFIPTATPSTDPTLVPTTQPYPSPTSEAEVCYKLEMMDSYGDGWNGASWTWATQEGAGNWTTTTGTLTDNSYGKETVCGSGCSTFAIANGGGYPYEITWTITEKGSNGEAEEYSGGAPSDAQSICPSTPSPTTTPAPTVPPTSPAPTVSHMPSALPTVSPVPTVYVPHRVANITRTAWFLPDGDVDRCQTMAIDFELNPNWRVYDVILNAGVSGDLDGASNNPFAKAGDEGVRFFYANRTGLNMGPERTRWRDNDRGSSGSDDYLNLDIDDDWLYDKQLGPKSNTWVTYRWVYSWYEHWKGWEPKRGRYVAGCGSWNHWWGSFSTMMNRYRYFFGVDDDDYQRDFIDDDEYSEWGWAERNNVTRRGGQCQQDCGTPYFDQCAKGERLVTDEVDLLGQTAPNSFTVLVDLDRAVNIRSCASGFIAEIMVSVRYRCDRDNAYDPDQPFNSEYGCAELEPASTITYSNNTSGQCVKDPDFALATQDLTRLIAFYLLMAFPACCILGCLVGCCGYCVTRRPEDNDGDGEGGGGLCFGGSKKKGCL